MTRNWISRAKVLKRATASDTVTPMRAPIVTLAHVWTLFRSVALPHAPAAVVRECEKHWQAGAQAMLCILVELDIFDMSDPRIAHEYHKLQAECTAFVVRYRASRASNQPLRGNDGR